MMARENKRKRDEKRFGRPERLADIVDFRGWTGVHVESTNVYNYYRKFMEERGSLDLMHDIPCARIPFPHLFIEMESGCFGGSRIGWAFEEIDPKGKLAIESAHAKGANGWTRAVAGFLYLGEEFFKEPPAPAMCVYHIVDQGVLVENPSVRVDSRFEMIASAMHVEPIYLAMETLVPILLAISFMNCKNVTLVEHAPDVKINRERQKYGLRSFVRYHTINIEPMKKVLKTEGQIETEGLKRALHICRGHFAHYTSNFMGRPIAEPMTIWRPAHVRGSLDNGLVVSDYNVNAPKSSDPATPADPATSGPSS